MFIYIVFLLITLLLLAFVFYNVQYFMIFTPTYKRAKELDESCEILSITTKDGIELEGVCYTPSNPKETLLFFAGRSHDSVGLISKLSQAYPKYRIISFNYRSYGKSKGKITEKILYSDALEILSLVKKHYGEFYLLGFSLGSSIVSYVSQTQQSKGVFLVGAFDSIASLIKTKYKFSLSKLLRYKFDTLSYSKNINTRTYMFSSKNDTITYYKNAINLSKNIKNLKDFVTIEEVSHQDLLWHKDVIDKIKKVIDNDT